MQSNSREVFRRYTSDDIFDRIIEYDTITEMWEKVSEEYPDNIAITDNKINYTYKQLDTDAALFRTRLSDGEKPLRIGLILNNSYDFVKAFLAVTTLGYTAVILPAQLDASAVYGCSVKYGLNKLIYSGETKEKTELAAVKLPALDLVDVSDMPAAPTKAVSCGGSTPCVIMFTGGTTGQSKGAILSNTAVMQGTVNGCYGYRDVFGQRYLLVLPLSHVFGLIRNLLTSLYTGSTLFICRSPKDMFADIAVFKPTILVLVPALANMALMLSKQFGRNMLGEDMKYIICGAAAVSPYLIAEYEKYGISLLAGYGLTESANLVSGNPESLAHPDSVGYMYPNQEYRIENGELWLKGKNMMDGYAVEDNSEAYEDGWFKTGDLVRMDEDGLLYITGRIKEVIVLENGENISPAAVEACFNELDFIQDSQVFEDEDGQGRHILALEVVPRLSELPTEVQTDANAYITSELNRVNMTLPSHERVSKITIRDTDFARSASMKIVRYKK